MKVLLTGCTGYIGKRLLHHLAERGDSLTCFSRNPDRIVYPRKSEQGIVSFKVDLFNPIPERLRSLELDVAFYLVHSMTSSINSFEEEEAVTAQHFADFIKHTNCKQIIYLSGISNSEHLSKHLSSRKNVEAVLQSSGVPLTVLRAGIIVGSGSASFEIIRDLMEKLPLMITPNWVKTLCQPVAIRDVLKFFTGCMLNEATFNQVFDIGGSEILSYKEMLMQYAEVRGLKRKIYTVNFISPRISSYWLYFVTTTSYYLAVNLVNSMKIEVVCKDNRLRDMLGIQTVTYREAVSQALERINLNTVASSWTDALYFKKKDKQLFDYMEVPQFGVLTDERIRKLKGSPTEVLDRIFGIGGNNGWYFMDWTWRIRGSADRLVKGVGLRRGRRSPTELFAGDALDFWRVLVAERQKMRLLLFAEMKIPGEAWLEFKITRQGDGWIFTQKATFMPKGLSGRTYWYALLPIHIFIFKGMADRIAWGIKSKKKLTQSLKPNP
jgi:uncharacterized protein YbjT (DUF2867 family)